MFIGWNSKCLQSAYTSAWTWHLMVWLTWEVILFIYFFCNYRWLSTQSGQVRRWALWTSRAKSKSIQPRSATPCLIKVLFIHVAHFRMLFPCQKLLNWLDWSYSPAWYQLAHQSFIARDIRWPQTYQAAQPSLYRFHHHMLESRPSHHQAAVSPLPLTKQSLDKALIQTAIQIQNDLLEECVRQITVTGLQAFKVIWTETLLTRIWLLNSSEPCDWSVTVMHFSISLSSWSTSNKKKK